jgi:hypothetical protein
VILRLTCVSSDIFCSLMKWSTSPRRYAMLKRFNWYHCQFIFYIKLPLCMIFLNLSCHIISWYMFSHHMNAHIGEFRLYHEFHDLWSLFVFCNWYQCLIFFHLVYHFNWYQYLMDHSLWSSLPKCSNVFPLSSTWVCSLFEIVDKEGEFLRPKQDEREARCKNYLE